MMIVLFISIAISIFLYLNPYIKKDNMKKQSYRNKSEKQIKISEVLERQLFAMGMSHKSYKIWEAVIMASVGIFYIVFTRNIIAALISAYTGKHILQMVISYKAGKHTNLIDSQTLQFVRGIADHLELGEIILNSVKYSALQLKDPLRTVILRAINKSYGDSLLSDNIRALSDELKTPVYKELGNILAKGFNEGASEISSAVRKIEEKLQEGEKVARRRADIIGGYIVFLLAMFLICLLSPMLLLVKPIIWNEAVNNVSWVFIAGSLITLYMASSLKKHIRMYVERSEVI